MRWLLLAFAVWVAAELISGIRYEGWESVLVVALVLGLLNLYVRPVFVLISLPVTILTLGLFLLILNALFLALASWITGVFGVNFHVDDFLAALLGAIIISIVGVVTGMFVKADNLARDLTRGR